MIRVVTLVVSRISTGCVRWFEPVVRYIRQLRHRSLGWYTLILHLRKRSLPAQLRSHDSVNTAAVIRVVTLVVSRISTGGVRWFEPVVSTSASSVTEVWVDTR